MEHVLTDPTAQHNTTTTPSLFGIISTATETPGLFGTTPACTAASSIASTPGLFSGATTACSNTVTNCIQEAAKGTMIHQASAPVRRDEAACHLAREIRHIQSRLQQQEYSLQSIQGEVANLSNKVAQINISLGVHVQDGTSHHQASSFGIQRDVQLSELPMFVVNDEETEGYSSENEIPFLLSSMSASATDQREFQALEGMPVFDVYDDDMDGCSTEFVDVLAGIPEQHTNEEEQQEIKQPTKCFSWPLFSPKLPSVGAVVGAVSDPAIDFTSTHVPHLFVDESIECQTNNDTELHSLSDSEMGDTIGRAQEVATQLWTNLLPEAGRQGWDPGIRTPSFMDLCLHWNQNIKFNNGIAVWLITFNPP